MDVGVQDNLHIGVPPLNEEETVDGGSPRSTASQDVGGLSPSSSGNLDDIEEPHHQMHARTRSLVRDGLPDTRIACCMTPSYGQ